MRILVCTATLAEFAACKAGIEKAGAIKNQFKVLRTGMGLDSARRILGDHLKAEKAKPDLIVSSGFAGLWRGEKDVGNWISADQIWVEHDNDFQNVTFRKGKAVANDSCQLVSVEHVQPLPFGLPEALAEGVLCVDMESAALAEVASTNGIPFTVFRLITDTPENPLPEYVSVFSSAILSKNWESKLWLAGQGLLEVAQNYKSVPAFLKNGKSWADGLSKGWQENAEKFLQ
jgi:hypothetical protein